MADARAALRAALRAVGTWPHAPYRAKLRGIVRELFEQQRDAPDATERVRDAHRQADTFRALAQSDPRLLRRLFDH